MADVARAETPLDLTLSDAECEAYRDHITDFVAERVRAADAEVAVIGLSGGIDSTLTAHLAVAALGADRVYGLVMPSEVNPEASTSDAERVADLLAIEYDVVGIEPVVDAFLAAIPGVSPDADRSVDPLRTAVGNLRARIRANLSYFAANRRGGIVLGTGNRSEALVGYFTKYGDGAVDCHPIGPLYKGQVRQLARRMGVPEDIVTKTAAAELWADHTDEAELGVDYPTLDAILALSVDGPLSPTATAREIGVDPDIVERIRAMHAASAHKRRAPPAPDPLF